MSEYDSKLSEYDNVCNKLAEIRGKYLWDFYPNRQAELIGCPYSVTSYTLDYLNYQQDRIKELETYIVDYDICICGHKHDYVCEKCKIVDKALNKKQENGHK